MVDDGDIPAEMRRRLILVKMQAQEFIRVSDISTMFRISDVTARSDLDILAEQGHLRRIRGGAILVHIPQTERPFEEAQNAYAAQKVAIGQAAAALVQSGESIILDVGTTSTEIARALIARQDVSQLIIFTNSLNIAVELEHAIPRFTVVVTGGTLRPMQHSLVDPLGCVMFDQINVHTVFLGCNGISPSAGITNINLPEAAVKQRMLRAARRRIVVADGSKVGTIELAYLCGVDEIDLLITDATADPAILAELRERKLEVLVA